MVPLLRSVFDYGSTPETYQRYDKMTAKELFRQYGVSQRLYDGFLRPLLLVGMFAPPEELSAAAMLSTFEFYSESLCNLCCNGSSRSHMHGQLSGLACCFYCCFRD